MAGSVDGGLFSRPSVLKSVDDILAGGKCFVMAFSKSFTCEIEIMVIKNLIDRYFVRIS